MIVTPNAETEVYEQIKNPLHLVHISHYPTSLHSIPEMRVLQISNILLTQISPNLLLFLLTESTLRRLLVSPPVLPHVISTPDTDENELQAEGGTGSNGARNVSWGVFGLEDLRAAHVADAVAQKGGG